MRDIASALRSDVLPVSVIGRACRLPGAPSVDAFWRLLCEGRAAVSQIGEERWCKAKYFHPVPGTPGKSYTFAAGVLEDVWGFDAAAFGFSPREVLQMDPQQRLVLKLVWEALEDAGIAAAALAGERVGVFAGASSLDHGNRRLFDTAANDVSTMTGNSLSLISNRISYIFNFSGPSFTLDTACSSSLVALHQAVQALRHGEVPLAVVAGVNMLLSPMPFTGFSAARMLSPEGVCRAFGGNPQGYVRSEGGVVLILAHPDSPWAHQAHHHASIVESGVNSDGRTFGIALPSEGAQATLLREVYARSGIPLDDLAFIEAHGTGTRAGDAAEARAIGEAVAMRRSRPLPIGSVKSNIGHLEPAAGLAGLLKAMLALEHGMLPATLHCQTLNPDIPFEQLNLSVAQQPVPIPSDGLPQYAGVSTFGFGGTNAHVVIAAGGSRGLNGRKTRPQAERGAPEASARSESPPHAILMFSAHCGGALKRLAGLHAAGIVRGADPATVARATAHQRDLLKERAAILPADKPQTLAALAAAEAGHPHPLLLTGQAVARSAPAAFVFSGNGSQWAGMGCAAYTINTPFRQAFDDFDALFSAKTGWSLREALFDAALDQRLQSTIVAQPLLFALQAALADSLIARGLEPDAVLGHSVGEVAAAYVAGALSRSEAIAVIVERSVHQEPLRGAGAMAAVSLSPGEAEAMIARHGLAGLTVAACNSPRSVTLSGESTSIERFASLAREHGIACKILDIDYPFHSHFMEPCREGLLRSLERLQPKPARIDFISTVTGGKLAGERLNAGYWWGNVREPVQFAQAVATAAQQGCRVFIEIGPRPILAGYLNACLAEQKAASAVIRSLDKRDEASIDPVAHTFARAAVQGARINLNRAYGERPAENIPLPAYPWQDQPYRLEPSGESYLGLDEWHQGTPYHPLIGLQPVAGAPLWRVHLDTGLLPYLADHKVGGKAVLPGAAFAEMAFAAASRWMGSERIEILDMDISQPLVFAENATREIQIELSGDSAAIDISSRVRLAGEDWQHHVTCRFASLPGLAATESAALAGRDEKNVAADRVYALTLERGLDYGPAFRLLETARLLGDDEVAVRLRAPLPATAHGYAINPTVLDAAFHGLFALFETEQGRGIASAYVPVRFGSLRILQPQSVIAAAHIRVRRFSPHSIQCDFSLLDGGGKVAATLLDARFKAVNLQNRIGLEQISYRQTAQIVALPGWHQDSAAIEFGAFSAGIPQILQAAEPHDEPRLLLEVAAQRLAFDTVSALVSADRVIDTIALIRDERLHPQHLPYLSALLHHLAAAGLASESGSDWRLADECPLPPLGTILATVMADHPDWGCDCVMLSRTASLLPDALQEPPGDAVFSASVLDHFAAASPRALAAMASITSALNSMAAGWPGERPLHILELGGHSAKIGQMLMPLLEAGRCHLTIAAPTALAANRLNHSFPALANLDILNAAAWRASAARSAACDIALSSGVLHQFSDVEALLRDIRSSLRPGGVFLAAEAVPQFFYDVAFGLQANWFSATASPGFPIGCLRSGAEWLHVAKAAGGFAAMASFGENALTLIAAQAGPAAHLAPHIVYDPLGDANGKGVDMRPALIISSDASGGLANALDASLRARGFAVWHALPETIAGDLLPGAWLKAAEAVIAAGIVPDLIDLTGECRVNGAAPHKSDAAETVTMLAKRLLQTQSLLSNFQGQPRLWIAARGSMKQHNNAPAAEPAQAAFLAALRAIRNEHPGRDIRAADFDTGLDIAGQAERLAAWIAAPGEETELLLGQHSATAIRIVTGLGDAGAPASRVLESSGMGATLLAAANGQLDQMRWQAVPRRAPQAKQVEIAVAAAGLNFRDVMWGLGLLPDEALEDGFAGPTLGFECAGRVARLGADCRGLAVGDPVIAMAPAAFASHVTVDEAAIVKLPEGLSLQAAATMPVAFLTAYYALVHLGQLRPGEWVLIHGGAGGVGLAALQVAKARGARVITTAGSEEKRALLRLLGAGHVLNSRSLEFADDVMRLTGGVDVVLNSLAGEAMERSLWLLKPFGRFLELGKRDYYGNTKIGLRPFRRNISYFGIDADQLLAHQPELARQMLQEILDETSAHRFSPLPYRCFEASSAGDAFRLMQQSGHIGKIILTPPAGREPVAQPLPASFRASEDGAHLIIGGLGGFGLAAARWLGRRGACHIVLTSRSGTLSPEAQNIRTELHKDGIILHARACDASDPAAMAALLDSIRKDMPLKGVMHAAMVLDDAPLAKLSEDRLARVMAPKMTGAELIGQLTQNDSLDYFVLFSSVAALIGNPGQVPYVAANAYLEALATMRRAAGLPALAVGWGAIADAGYLARNTDVGDIIQRRTGSQPFTAGQALECLGDLLALGERAPPAVTLAPVDWSAAGAALSVFATPAFSVLRQLAERGVKSQDTAPLDVAAMIEGLSESEAKNVVARLIAEDVAAIFRMPAADISPERPLADLGMDSLMLVELRLSAQRRFGMEIPLSAASESLTVNSIAQKIVQRLSGGRAEPVAGSAVLNELAFEHVASDDHRGAARQIAAQIEQQRAEGLLS